MRLRALTSLASSLVALGLLAAGLGAAAPAHAADPPRPIGGGWFGWWVSPDEARAMAEQSDGVIPEVSIFWWSFQGAKQPLCTFNPSSGSCWTSNPTPWTTDNLDQVRRILQGAGIKVQGSITDVYSGTAGQLADYIKTPKRREAYATRITTNAVKAGLDGIDLDWENFAFNDGHDSWPTTRPNWIAFVKTLGEHLHAEGLTVSATVPGGVATNDTNTGYDVYAWGDIIDSLDRLQIMAYDYSWTLPGPIGPNNWADQVVTRAIADVGQQNAGKIWIGAPQYGRSWPLQADNGGWASNADCPVGWKPASTPVRTVVTPDTATSIAADQKIDPTWDPQAGEYHFTYTVSTPGTYPKKVKGKKKPVPTAKNCDVERETWYGDTRSALARASLVPDHKIGGIVVWDFGTIESDFYTRLAAYGSQIAPAPTTVSLRAPRSVVHGKPARLAVTATSRSGAAQGAAATLYWKALSSQGRPTKVSTITLDKSGNGVFTPTPEKNGTWSVSVAGSWSRRAGQSDPATTKVKFAVDRRPGTWSPNVGSNVPLTVTVAPAIAGIDVLLQRQGTQGWTTLKTLTTAADGTAATQVRPTMVRPVTYRFVAKENADYARGISKAMTLNVQPRAAFSINEPVTRWGE